MRCSKIVLIALCLFANTLMAAPQDIVLWRHMATSAEIEASFAAIQRFNQSQNQWNVIPDLIPEASYTLSIKAAAHAEVLPCIIEVDQPLVPYFAWNGFIKPLDGLIDHHILSSIQHSGKGTYQDRVYSVGPLDVSLALFTRKSLLKKTGTRYPTMAQPWSKDEFMAFLDAVKLTGEYPFPFDMQAQDKTEWIPYAWAPFMISWGADLIDRNDYLTVDGVLNGNEAIQFGQWIQHLINDHYMNPHPENNDGFINGEIGVQYGGSWDLNTYYKAFKDDLAVLPVPDFGHGVVTGGGSWHWAMTETCEHPKAAKALITFLMSPAEQAAMSNVLGIFPTNNDAAEQTKHYAKDGQWRMLFDFSKRFAVMRPETPAYTEIANHYKKAMRDIINGMPPALALDLAVENIKAAFERHQNYKAQ